MKLLLIIPLTLTLILLIGCSDDPKPTSMWLGDGQHIEPDTTPQIKVTAKWVHKGDYVESYELCVDDISGQILIETMHANGNSDGGIYGVYQHGASIGEYITKEAAIKAASQITPQCPSTLPPPSKAPSKQVKPIPLGPLTLH